MEQSLDVSSCSIESLLSVPIDYIFRETRTGQIQGNASAPSNNTTNTSIASRSNTPTISNLHNTPHTHNARNTPNNPSTSSTRHAHPSTHANTANTNLQRTFLFSKSEVSSLIRVSLLASELDALLELSYESLYKSRQCREFRKVLEQANHNSKPSTDSSNSTNNTNSSNSTQSPQVLYQRALLPLLQTHATIANIALQHTTSHFFGMARILDELEGHALELEKFADQNLLIADQFDWAGSHMFGGVSTNLLSNEKRAIAEIELGCCERIRSLRRMAMDVPGDGDGSGNRIGDGNRDGDGDEPSYCPMAQLCDEIFKSFLGEESVQGVQGEQGMQGEQGEHDEQSYTNSKLSSSKANHTDKMLISDEDKREKRMTAETPSTAEAREETNDEEMEEVHTEEEFAASQLSISGKNAAAALHVMGSHSPNF